MSGAEVLVAVVCLLAGYWIVLKLMSRPPPETPAPWQSPVDGGFENIPAWTLPDGSDATSWSVVLGIGADATV